MAAYAFARLNFRLKWLWFALMLGTIMLPIHVQLIPQYIFFLKIGWVNTILPLVVPKFLAHDAFFIFLMVQFMRSLPPELEQAAIVDGASLLAALLAHHPAAVDAGAGDHRGLHLHQHLQRLLLASSST